MELYHKITKEVLELLLKEGAQMPVDLARKLQRSSSNMQQVREYLSGIGCIDVTKQRNFYELKISDKGIQLLEVMKQMESLDKPGSSPLKQILKQLPDSKAKEEAIAKEEKKEKPIPDSIMKAVIDKAIEAEEPPKIQGLNPKEEIISRGGRRGILRRF